MLIHTIQAELGLQDSAQVEDEFYGSESEASCKERASGLGIYSSAQGLVSISSSAYELPPLDFKAVFSLARHHTRKKKPLFIPHFSSYILSY